MVNLNEENAEKLTAGRKLYEKKMKKPLSKNKTSSGRPSPRPPTDIATNTPTTPITTTTDNGNNTAATAAVVFSENPAVSSTSFQGNHQRSASFQSKQRSEIFRCLSISTSSMHTGPSSMESPHAAAAGEVPTSGNRVRVQNSNEKLAAPRLEDLERENLRLSKELGKLPVMEEELEELRAGKMEVTELKNRGTVVRELEDEIMRLKSEVVAIQRQNSQLQAQATKSSNRILHASSIDQNNASFTGELCLDELVAQVASKSNTIEVLELEISKLNATIAAQGSETSNLTMLLETANKTANAKETELAGLKLNHVIANDLAQDEGIKCTSMASKITSLEEKIVVLKLELEESRLQAERAEGKAEMLRRMLHDAEGRAQEAEKAEKGKTGRGLKQVETDLSTENVGVGGLDFEHDRHGMRKRIMQLEGELFDAKREIWSQKRLGRLSSGSLTHEAGDDTGGDAGWGGASLAFDEVELSAGVRGPMAGFPGQDLGGNAATNGRNDGAGFPSGGGGASDATSALQNVFSGGISAILGSASIIQPGRRQGIGTGSGSGGEASEKKKEDAFENEEKEWQPSKAKDEKKPVSVVDHNLDFDEESFMDAMLNEGKQQQQQEQQLQKPVMKYKDDVHAEDEEGEEEKEEKEQIIAKMRAELLGWKGWRIDIVQERMITSVGNDVFQV